MSYPVSFDVERPPTFQRAHVFLRVALLIVVGWIGHPFGLLWLGVPVVVAILLAQKGGQRYLDEDGPTLTRVFTWILAVIAYLALLTDRLPTRDKQPVRFEVERSGSPTVSSALLRILYSIPSLIVLALLVFVGAFVWLLAVVLVLVNKRYPESAWRFLCSLVRWEANLFAYLASLTDRYPLFRLQTHLVSSAAPSS
jgi:Domain of unknown function (DUF4389)